MIIRDHGQVTKHVHEELNYNYRITNIAAAIERVQLRKPDFFDERRQNANYLTKNLGTVRGVVMPCTDPRVKHAYHRCVIRVEEIYPLDRDELALRLKEKGIITAIHYSYLCTDSHYKKLGRPPRYLP